MKNRLHGRIVCWLLGVFFALPASLSAAPVEENALKAAFIYNFISFTEWPAGTFGAGGAINLCADSRSPMASSMAALNGKHIKAMRLNLHLLDSLQSDLSPCHILYIDRTDRQNWTPIKKKIDNASIITISDDSEINASGVMIALSTLNNKIVFDIDMNVTQRARLAMSSKLLRLARTVR